MGIPPDLELETSVAGGAPAEAGHEASIAARALSAPVDASGPGLLQNRDFRLVLVGQGVSALGDAITFTALPLLVVALTGSGVAMGTVGVLQTLPDLFFGLLSGALADRWDRRRLIILADLGRALLTAMVPLSYALGWPTIAVILLVTFPINTLRVVFLSAWTAAIPSLVGREQVGRANGLAEAIFSVSFIVGPAIAGLLVAVIGPGPTLAIDAASFLASAAAMTLVHRPLQAQRERARTHILSEIAEGLRYLARERVLRVVVAFWSVVSVMSAPLVPAVIFYLTKDRHATSDVVGLIISGYGVGYLVGALLAGRFAKGRLGLIMLGANGVLSVSLVGFAELDHPVAQAVMTFLAGVGGALTLIPYITLRATIPPDELLGRVGSTARTISLGLSPIGLIIGGLALDVVGGAATLLAIAGLVVLASVAFAFSASLRSAVAGPGREQAHPG